MHPYFKSLHQHLRQKPFQDSIQERDRQVKSCNCLFESFGRANPNNSRSARYSLLVAIPGLTEKNVIFSPYSQKDPIYRVLFDFSNSFEVLGLKGGKVLGSEGRVLKFRLEVGHDKSSTIEQQGTSCGS